MLIFTFIRFAREILGDTIRLRRELQRRYPGALEN